MAFFGVAASSPKADPSRASLFDQSDLLFVGYHVHMSRAGLSSHSVSPLASGMVENFGDRVRITFPHWCAPPLQGKKSGVGQMKS
jgi:hypothetical protein